ncbi:DUF5995 family protein [Puniceicoccaceae bacterium K14]|nr:DUF5995 family protein [Puniceicoccaceae bacterium K14]
MQTIDTVVESLDKIIESARSSSSPLGYFPALYRRVTLKVNEAIQSSRFENGPRMEQLVVIFAGRYIDAYESYTRSGKCTQSWQIAFENEDTPSLTVLQHLLLGMNAHISLDLGIAAAEVAKNNPLDLKDDFNLINEILGDQINDTQRRLTRIFGPLGWFDSLLGSIDEQLSLFSLHYARDKAWTQMLELVTDGNNPESKIIPNRDKLVAQFSSKLIHPPKRLLRILLWLVRILERGRVKDRIDILAQ